MSSLVVFLYGAGAVQTPRGAMVEGRLGETRRAEPSPTPASHGKPSDALGQSAHGTGTVFLWESLVDVPETLTTAMLGMGVDIVPRKKG